jgi:2-oxoglutarate ferredoxin oxidoreductase subunit beta
MATASNGGDHFIHTMRRNVDLLYLAMDNQIYGLTTGEGITHQPIGRTSSCVEGPTIPLLWRWRWAARSLRAVSAASKATHRSHQGSEHQDSRSSTCSALRHLIRDNTYPWFKQRQGLEEDSTYDSSNWQIAIERSQLWERVIPSVNS